MFSKLASQTMEPTHDGDVVVTFLSHDVNTGAMAAAAIIEMIECLSIFIALSLILVGFG